MSGLYLERNGILRPVGSPMGMGYDGVVDKSTKRSVKPTVTKSEDAQLTTSERRKLNASTRDQQRNFAIAAWMIRKHLEYVSRFNFQGQNADKGFNDELEAWMANWSLAPNCDIAGRHSLASMITLAEMHAVRDGDIALMKLQVGKLQGIEGDRIRRPSGGVPPQYADVKLTHGVEVTSAGAAKRYMICKREGSSLKFDLMAQARNVIMHGYYTRFDQVRGVSPLSCSLNSLQDLYESLDYNLIKAKLHALFGLAITRNAADTPGGMPLPSGTEEAEAEDTDPPPTREKVAEIKPGVATILDLEPGEEVGVVESKSPSAEFTNYSDLIVKIALLSLDIPWLFFDALKGSYSVHRTVAIQYEKSVRPKREPLQGKLDHITAWRLGMAIDNGEFILPAGMEFRDVRWEWQPDGTPWIDPLKEVQASQKEVSSAFTSGQRVCKARGLDAFKIVDEIKELQDYAKEQGVTVAYGQPAAPGGPAASVDIEELAVAVADEIAARNA